MEKPDPSGLHLSTNPELVNEYLDEFGNIDITSTHLPGYSIFMDTTATDIQMGEKQEPLESENVVIDSASMPLETCSNADPRRNISHDQAGMANSAYFPSVDHFSGEDFPRVSIEDSSQGASISGNPHFPGFEDVLMADESPETVLDGVFKSEGPHEGVAIQAHDGVAIRGNTQEDSSVIAAAPLQKDKDEKDAVGSASDVKELSAQLDGAGNVEVPQEENVGERLSITGKEFIADPIVDQKMETVQRDLIFTDLKQHELPASETRDVTALEPSMAMQGDPVHHEKSMQVHREACTGSDSSDLHRKEVACALHGRTMGGKHGLPLLEMDTSALEVSMTMQGDLVQHDKPEEVLREAFPGGDCSDLQIGVARTLYGSTLEKQYEFPALELNDKVELMTQGDPVHQHDIPKEVQGEVCSRSGDSLVLHKYEVDHTLHGSTFGGQHELPALEVDKSPLELSVAYLGQCKKFTQEEACHGSDDSSDLPDVEVHGSPGEQSMDTVDLLQHGTSKESSQLGISCDSSEQITPISEGSQSEDKPTESGSSDPNHTLVHSIENKAEDLFQLAVPCNNSEQIASAYEDSQSEDTPMESGSSDPNFVPVRSVHKKAEDAEKGQGRIVMAVEGTETEPANIGVLNLDNPPAHEHSLVASSQTETGPLTLLCRAAAAHSLQNEQVVPSSGCCLDSFSDSARKLSSDNVLHEQDVPGSHAALISKQASEAADGEDRKAMLSDAQGQHVNALDRSTIISADVDGSNESLGELKGKQDVKEIVIGEGVELAPFAKYLEGEEDVKESCSDEGISTTPSINTSQLTFVHPAGGAEGASSNNAAINEANQMEEEVHPAGCGKIAPSSNAAISEACQMEEDVNAETYDADQSTKLEENNVTNSMEICGAQPTSKMERESLLKTSEVIYESVPEHAGICDHKQTDEAEEDSLLIDTQQTYEAEENSLPPNVEIGDAKHTSDEEDSCSENTDIGDTQHTCHMEEDSSSKETSEGETGAVQNITEVDDAKQTSDNHDDVKLSSYKMGQVESGKSCPKIFKPGSAEAVGGTSEHLGLSEGNLQVEKPALHVEEDALSRQAGWNKADKHAGGFLLMKKSYNNKSKGRLSQTMTEKHGGGALWMKKMNADMPGSQHHTDEQITKVGKDGASFTVGDLVWAKVKSHPWWPGMIFDVADASDSAKKLQRSGRILVAFFADCTFAWLHRSQMVPFESNFKVKVKQTNMKIFCRAVIEALEEVCRRAELGFRCRHFEGDLLSAGGFPDTNAGIQKGARIMRHRDISQSQNVFDPDRILQFVKAAACAPLGSWSSSPEVAKSQGHAYALRACMLVSERSKTDELLENMLLNIKGGKAKRKFISLEADEECKKAKKMSMEKAVGVRKTTDLEQDCERLRSTKSSSTKGGLVAKKAKTDKAFSVRKTLVGEDESETPGSLKSLSMKSSSGTSGKKVIPSDLTRKGESSKDVQLKRRFVNKESEGNKKVKTCHEPSIEKDVFKHSSETGADSDRSSHDDSETLFALAGRSKLLKKIKKGKLQDIKHHKSAVDISASKEHAGALRESSIIAIGSPKKSSKKDSVSPAKSTGLGNCTRVLPLVEDEIFLDTRKDEKKLPKTHATPVSLPQRKVQEDTGKVNEVKQSAKVSKHPEEEDKKLDSPQNSSPRRPAKFAKLGDCIRRIAGELSGTPGKLGDEGLAKKAVSSVSVKAGLKEEREATTPELSELSKKLKNPVNELIDGIPDPVFVQLFDCLQYLARDPLNNAGMKVSPATIAAFLKFRNLVFQKSSGYNTTTPSVEHGPGSRDFEFDDSEPPNQFEAVTARKQPGVQNVTFKKTVATQHLSTEARKRKVDLQEGSLRTSKKVATQGLRIVKPRATMDGPVEQRHGPERGYVSSSHTKSWKKGGNDKVPLGPPFGLFMKFPRNFALPSEAELKATFVRFGPIEQSETRVYRSTASAIVVFKQAHDAEVALKYAKENSIFGKAAVAYRVREFVRRPDAKQDVLQTDKGKLPSRMESRSTMQRHGERHTLVESKADLGRTSNSADGLVSTKVEDTRNSSPALNLVSLISNSKPSAADPSGDIQDKMMKLLRQVSVIVGGSSPIAQDATPARAPQS